MTLAVDAGGTYFRAEVYKNAKSIQSFTTKSATIGLAEWIESILQEYQDIRYVCIAYAGQVKEGVILSAPNIEVDEHQIKKVIQERFDVKLFIENDLNCAVLAEAEYFKSSDLCAVYVGTGIGLGVMSSSKLIRGFGSVATELGHIPYEQTPFVCGCGKSNCIELFASGSALQKWKDYLKINQNLTLEDLKNSIKKDENELYEKFEKALIYAIATAVTLFNPEVLVLGGGIIASNKEICDIISAKMENYAMPVAVKNLKIYNSEIKDAALEGALLLKDKDV